MIGYYAVKIRHCYITIEQFDVTVQNDDGTVRYCNDIIGHCENKIGCCVETIGYRTLFFKILGFSDSTVAQCYICFVKI